MKSFVSVAIVLWLAAGAQAAWAERLAIGPAKPDFLLVSAVLFAMHRSSDSAAVIGFFAGLLHGAILNSSMAAFIVSRTLACFSAARMSASAIGTSPTTVALLTGICTGIAGIIYLFFGLQKNIFGWATATIGATIYNALLAVVFYWVYRVVARPAASR